MRGGEAHPFMTVKVERTLPRPRFGGEGTLNQQHCYPRMAAMNSLFRLIKSSSNALELMFFGTALVLLNLPLLSGGFCESMIYFPHRVAMGEWWRTVSHPLVHLTWYHLLLDGGAFLLLYGGLEEQRPIRRIGYVGACAMGSLLVSTLASPVVQDRGLCGLSGIAHGLMAISALESIRRQSLDGKWCPAGMISLGIVVVKSVVEVLQGHVFFEFLHFGMMGLPVPESHAGGVLSGIVAFLVFGSLPLGAANDRADRVLVMDHRSNNACES
jgi:rhomboid family GlyGly-CTERM serine protease